MRLARIARRLAVPFFAGCLLLLWLCFGAMRVHREMDTLSETVPPGSLCIVDKRAGSARVGDAVFVELEAGGILLSRVERETDDGLVLRNDNDSSRWPDSRTLGPIPRRALLGTVRAVFPPDADEMPRDGK
ncbi:MAG: hypothetical protein Fur0037_11160 [Planctomycetota bacterium]